MAKSIELPKLPLASSKLAASERDLLPFSSVAVASLGETAAQNMGEFQAYLNRRSILRLSRHGGKSFDPAAEILRRSVYKPIKLKPGP